VSSSRSAFIRSCAGSPIHACMHRSLSLITFYLLTFSYSGITSKKRGKRLGFFWFCFNFSAFLRDLAVSNPKNFETLDCFSYECFSSLLCQRYISPRFMYKFISSILDFYHFGVSSLVDNARAKQE